MRQGLRVLGPDDVALALRLLATDPVTDVFVEHRTRLTQLDRRWLGGEIWGWFEDGELVSMCHAGANFVPVQATPEALKAYADRALTHRVNPVTFLGPADDVRMLWAMLQDDFPRPRDARWVQPHLVIDHDPAVAADPLVTVTPAHMVDVLYPACVAMYTAEVGLSPEIDGGRALYRTRVSQLVHRGWSFSRIEGEKVLFKAEVACASPHAAQVQGVWVDPSVRGQGLATAGMAAVVEHVRREIAPTVSLYVNEHNAPARAAYDRVGFRRHGTFATVMF